MKVQVEGHEFSIEFAYSVEPSRYEGPSAPLATMTWIDDPPSCRAREAATCLIRDGDERKRSLDPSIRQPIVARGTVIRYFKDPPNRELARKHALTKALANLDEVLATGGADTSGSREGRAKTRRRMFWEAYLRRKRVPVPGASTSATGAGGEA